MNSIMQHHAPSKPRNGHLSPIEFPRYVLLEARESPTRSTPTNGKGPSLIPTVEVYPAKFTYKVVKAAWSDTGTTTSTAEEETSGFVLASKTSYIVHVLREAMNLIAPTKSSTCVRLWSRRNEKATREGDGHELVDLETLDGLMMNVKKHESTMRVSEWISRQGSLSDLLVETRNNASSPWPRSSLELANRLQVGDFVDAQDTAGKWYEAIVRELTDGLVKIHYAGWATKWDTNLRRRNNGEMVEGAARGCLAPAPLWTHTSRWRPNVKVGDKVEVRDSTSHVKQPKWFRGSIIGVGKENEPPRDLYDGAMLEKFEVSDNSAVDNRKPTLSPLLILKRTQQVLVEVPQEKIINPALVSQTVTEGEVENPPYIRWVNLYGEEICELGSHMKLDTQEKRPATISYDFDPRKPPVEVLKSQLYGAGFVRESLRGQPPAPGSVGLQNLGNSCFMNSIVQCLNQCDPISQFFLSEKYAQDLNRKNPLGSGGRVAMAYASLLIDIWGGQYSVLAPRLLKQTIANFAPQFNNVYQHDSHEFCSFLMDGIHEDCNRVKVKPYVEELEGFGVPDHKIAMESWRRHLLRHDSIIVDHCQGMHRSHVTCPICGRESIKFDVYSSLSVPLTFSKDRLSIPLDDCLEKFTEGEQLDENNAWYCPSCKKHVCALKMLALWSVPDILIIHLKRFTYENKNGGVVRSKMEDKVVFPIDNLDMSPYLLGPVDDETPPVYNLFGVSEHSGVTANSGHYTATVRNCKDGKWYRYNDSHVGSSSGEASVTGGAYLLFYKRAKGVARWGGMEKVINEAEIDPHGALETDVDGFKEVKIKKKTKKK